MLKFIFFLQLSKLQIQTNKQERFENSTSNIVKTMQSKPFLKKYKCPPVYLYRNFPTPTPAALVKDLIRPGQFQQLPVTKQSQFVSLFYGGLFRNYCSFFLNILVVKN